MEFTKDIYFDDNLMSGNTAKITYSGELFKNGSEFVNLVYGFGEAWENTTTQPMRKTKDGFVADIKVLDYDTFNFCFSNENNVWDNNNSFNYISPILPNVNDIIVDEDVSFDSDCLASIDNIIDEILGNTVQNSIANNNESQSVDKILESISEEALPEVEELFTELFEIPSAEKVDVQEVENIEKAQVVDEVEDANAKLVDLFNELFEDASTPAYFENEEKEENTENVEVPDIISDLAESLQNITLPEAPKFDLDNLVSDVLEPVITPAESAEADNDDTANDVSLFDDINEENEKEEETALTVVDEANELLVSSRKLSYFYKLKKKIKIACYKLFVKVPKELAKQMGFGQN